MALQSLYPLSYGQQALWFLYQLAPTDTAYNVTFAARIRADVDPAALHQAAQALVDRHALLRTTFLTQDGTPRQWIHPEWPVAFREVDATRASRDAVLDQVRAEYTAPFDLEQGPVFRITLFRQGADDYLLVLTAHHIVLDLWSLMLMVQELGVLYAAIRTGTPAALPPPGRPYAEYVAAQATLLTSAGRAPLETYWAQQLAGRPPALNLPTDRPRSPTRASQGTTYFFQLPEELTGQLQAVAAAEGATLYMTLLAAFAVLLYRYSSQTEFLLGSPSGGRSRPEFRGTVGYFINPLVIRADLAANPPFTAVLQRIRQTVAGARAHQEYPFPVLVERLQPEREPGRSPLFDVMFDLNRPPPGIDPGLYQILGGDPRARVGWGGLQLESIAAPIQELPFDLTLRLIEARGALYGTLHYNADLFDESTIARLVQHFQTLLESIGATPQARVAGLPFFFAAARQRVLVEWNATATAYATDQLLPQRVAAQAARTPAAIAARCGGQVLTYAQLNGRANQLAHHLRRHGVGPEVPVAICLHRSLDLLVGLLGILKAGGVYLPLDPTYPPQRLAYMLDDSQVSLLLTEESLLATCPPLPAPPLCLDTLDLTAEPTTDPDPGLQPPNLAYMIYTSGSTGRPKAVQVTHGGLLNLLLALQDQLAVTAGDVLLAVTSLSFDIAGLELYLPLIAGGQVLLGPVGLATDEIRTLLGQERVTLMQATPATWQLLVEAGWTGDPGLTVLCGGEALPAPLATALRARAHAVWNLYGPTETTIWSTARCLTDAAGPVPIGRPLANTQVYILDADGQPVPIGVLGELYIGGAGLARGYRGRPDLSAERFVPDPFSSVPGARIYRTGDQVRWRPDGTIEFLGRTDHQVKIHGYRIELGEIEALLRQHPALRAALVVAREDTPGARRLVAYGVPAPGDAPTTSALRQFLATQLPEYMIPAAFVLLSRWPLTPNGKIDRRALPPPAPERPDLDSALAEPQSPIEELLVGIWSTLLGLSEIGIHDSFFELGGHSLLATRVMSRIREAIGVEVPLRCLFEAPTIAQLARVIAGLGSSRLGPRGPVETIPVRPPGAELPASFAQQRLWFLEQLEPGRAIYHIPLALRLVGPLNLAALAASLQEIVQRHESLRTTFAAVDGRPLQVIRDTLPVPLEVIDLRPLAVDTRAIQVRQIRTTAAQQPFDLQRGPLLRTALLRLGPDEYLLLVTFHHSIADGWSSGLFWRELAAVYTAFSRGEPSPLPPLPIQYADFALWQRQWLQGDVLRAQLAYWESELVGAPPLLELPTDRPRPAMQTFRGAQLPLHLPAPLTTALKRLSQAEGVTLFMTLLAAFQVLLTRYSGQTDILVGTPIANRTRPELEGLIGFFANTLVIRTDLAGAPSFRQLLQRVREKALGAYAHQDVPFEKLVEVLQPDRHLSQAPVFQVLFGLQHTPVPLARLGDLQAELLESQTGTAKFDLSVQLDDRAGELAGALEYNTDLFDGETIARLGGHFLTLLQAVAADPAGRIADLPLLGAEERQQLLEGWNATATAYPGDQPIHRLFEAQARRTPRRRAVVFGDESLTYRELNSRANQLAHYLRTLGVGPETPVGLCLERSLEMIVGLLGILKAGGAYVPLDPTYPPERLAAMREHTPVLVTQQRLIAAFGRTSAAIVCLDGDWPRSAAAGTADLPGGAAADNMAYVIYTSGSTGRPKGVVVPHRAVANLATGLAQAIYAPQRPAHLQVSVNGSLAFDTSVKQIIQLLAGHTLHLIPEEIRYDGAALLAYLEHQQIEVFDCTPSQLQLLIAAGLMGRRGYAPRIVLVGGEAIDETTWRVLARSERINFYNVYGPTECTVDTATCWVQPASDRPTIGRPIANARTYVLDRQGAPVPIGVPGELYIGGAGVARGYLQQPALTAERFLPDPFSPAPGARMYRTGDQVRWQRQGTLEFLGRIDQQVKIRGHRIELGEIEATLAQHPAVAAVAVLARQETAQTRRLVAYVVPQPGPPPAAGRLRQFVQTQLPDYMIPGAFVFLAQLPLTPNGKLNRQALPAPAPLRPELATGFVAPRTPTEQVLAGIWATILRVEQVGIHDNFFELGGDSILSMQIIARATAAGLHLTPRQLFQHQTIATLATLIGQGPDPATEQGLVRGPVPLTPVQHRFFEQDLPDPHHWNQAFYLEVAEPCDPRLLEQAVAAVIRQHDALRLRFVPQDSGWQQRHGALDPVVPFQWVDLAALSAAEQGAVLQATTSKMQASLHLTAGPVLRVVYFDRGRARPGRLLLVIHHLVVDGVSWRILLEDLQTAYRQLRQGRPVRLPAKTTPFKAWAQRLAEYARTPALDQEWAYWLAAGRASSADLPGSAVDPPNTEAAARVVSVALSRKETQALLQDVPRAYQSQINDVLLTALALAVRGWTGQTSVLVDLEGHGREDLFDDVNVSRTVGWFTTIFPVQLDLRGTHTPVETLHAVKAQLRRIPHRGLGYGVLRYLSGDADRVAQLRSLPQPQISFNYLGQFDQVLADAALFRLAPESSGPAHGPHGQRLHLLDVNGMIAGAQLRLDWTYNPLVHPQPIVTRLAERFLATLRAIIKGAEGAREIEDVYPLAPLQETMLAQAPRAGVYYVQFSGLVRGELDTAAFLRAWQQVVDRQPVLRTAFPRAADGTPVQQVQRQVVLPTEQLDWRSLSASEQQARLAEFRRADRDRGFVLSTAPLARLALIRLADRRYQLIWATHHLLLDGWSWPLLFQEVAALYRAGTQGQELPPAGTEHYHAYIRWLGRQDAHQAEHFWRRLFAGFPGPRAQPLATPRNGHDADAGYGEDQVTVAVADTRALQAFARAQHVTVNTLVQGAWALVLGSLGAGEDVVFGVTVAHRPAAIAGAESMLGLLLNTLPLRVQIRPAQDLGSWLQDIQAQQAAAYEYAYSSPAQIQAWSGTPGPHPLFETTLRFQNYPLDEASLRWAPDLEITDVEWSDWWHYPLNVVVTPGLHLGLAISYDKRQFDSAAIRAILTQFHARLQAIAHTGDPARPLADLLRGVDDVLTLAGEA